MEIGLESILGFVGIIMGSGGFWAFMASRKSEKKAETRLLMGLSLDKIIYLGSKYQDRGYLSQDEYEDLHKYFYEPYKELGGNGIAENMMGRVEKLEVRSRHKSVELTFGSNQQNANTP